MLIVQAVQPLPLPVRYSIFTRLLWFGICVLAAWGTSQYDRYRSFQSVRARWQQVLTAQSAQLQAHLDSIAQHNQALATKLAQEPHTDAAFLTPLIQHTLAAQPLIRNTLVTREYKGIFVYPLAGNEAVVGLNYALRPEFLDSIERARRAQSAVLDAPVRLIQTGENALIARSAIFVPALHAGVHAKEPHTFWGHVASVVELPVLLRASGLLGYENDWSLCITTQTQPHQPHQSTAPDVAQRIGSGGASVPALRRVVWGQLPAHDAPILAQTQVRVSDVTWQLTATALPSSAVQEYPLERWVLIATLWGMLGVLPLLHWWWISQSYAKSAAHGHLDHHSHKGRGLRAVLLMMLLLPVPVLVGVTALLSFQASIGAAHELEQRQASEVAQRIHDRTTAFFDIPRQMLIYNAEQFRTGQLDLAQPKVVQSNFLLQLRHQPLLTFLSIGTHDNAYYSASRPPLGQDKSLRALSAGAHTNYRMQMHRVDDDYSLSTEVILGDGVFHAHQRPWYQAAVTSSAVRWYPTYRYAINDPAKQYETLGMGMATPLYDNAHRFVGVLAADVALSQLSTFLRTQMQPLGGLAFLTEHSGELLASSNEQLIYRLQNHGTAHAGVQRIRATDSTHPLTRSSQEAVLAEKMPQGRRRMQLQGVDYLLNWQSITLPNGPTFTLVVALPQSHFNGPARQTLHQVVVLALMFGLAGVLLALWLAQRLASPLLSLHRWAGKLAQGHWQSPPPLQSTVREVTELSETLGDMAQRLQRHTEELEQRVAARTAALEQVNRQLEELATTDALTDIANRRHFDRVLAAECARAQRSGLPLALLMLDVDNFKPYNDHYGHPAGDAILQAVAAALQSRVCRAGDLLARYGGEEFVVIAVNTHATAAQELGEALRDAVAQLQLPHIHAPLGYVTVSVGVTVRHPVDASFAEQGLQQADQALYRAKAQGRNQVVMQC